MQTRYDAVFSRAAAEDRGVFVPFVTLGDPNVEASIRVVETLIDAGADALELGFPYSDPTADGPVIEAASVRALAAGMKTAHCFDLIARIRQKSPDIPIGLLVYANLVVARGMDHFYARAAAVGVDAVLVADVPIFESAPFIACATAHGVAPVFIATPNADDARLKAVATASQAFTYVVSRAGVTGADEQLQTHTAGIMAKLRALGAAPPLLGFGISRPEHAAQAIAQGAAGAISGSAVVARVAKLATGEATEAEVLAELHAFVRSMREAVRRPRSGAGG
jgi:tryptophan synthase alpha chain